MNGNNDGYFRFCRHCGYVYNDNNATYCWSCYSYDAPITSNHLATYYLTEAKRLGIKDYCDILFENEIKKLPTFNPSIKQLRLSDDPMFSPQQVRGMPPNEKDKIESLAGGFVGLSPKDNSSPSPECPTCHSKNVRKISVAKRVVFAGTFGLFSKTARSQFECKDCGYKW